jgi:hypothetical protein
MTTKSFLTASAFFMAVALGCNTDTPITPAMKLTPVLVESGNISGTTFTSSGAFKASDKAIGYADSTQTKANGYWGQDNYVYVFEGNTIPSVIDKLPASEKYYCLTSATWVASATYAIKKDMEIEVKANYFYVRDHYVTPEIKREEATVLGKKVYRYKDQWWIEDYRNEKIRNGLYESKVINGNFTNYFEVIEEGVTATNYTITSERSNKTNAKPIALSANGVLNVRESEATFFDTTKDDNDYDRIYYYPKNSSLPKYRFRSLIMKHSEEILEEYFDQKTGIVKDSTAWEGYMEKNYDPYFVNNKVSLIRRNLKIKGINVRKEPPSGEQ